MARDPREAVDVLIDAGVVATQAVKQEHLLDTSRGAALAVDHAGFGVDETVIGVDETVAALIGEPLQARGEDVIAFRRDRVGVRSPIGLILLDEAPAQLARRGWDIVCRGSSPRRSTPPACA